jgi:chaperonin GroEL
MRSSRKSRAITSPSAAWLGTQANVNEVDAAIQTSKSAVVEKLRAMAKPIKTEKELIDVATVSGGNPTLGEIIGKIYWQLGKDGHISLEFNLLSEQIEHEIVPGLRFSGGYAADWMITDQIRKTCTLKDAPVLVTQECA